MEAVPRLPMLNFPGKLSTENVEFGTKLKRYIRDHYNEDPDSYNNEIGEFEGLRRSAVNAPTDFVGCSTLKKYYCQLRNLASRFPLTESGIGLSFQWGSAFDKGFTTSGDINYEMHNVLYNIATLHMDLGSVDPRTTSEGMKISCTHFQCAAWAFQSLNQSLQNDVDLNPLLMNFMMNVCLSQAQECILEKSMTDNRKPNIIAKVSIQVVEYLRLSMNHLDSFKKSGSVIVDQIGSKQLKNWQRHIEFKMAYYSAVTLFHQGLQSEERQMMGERIAYFEAALEKLEESSKIAKNLDKVKVNETLTFANDVIAGKLIATKKENEFVYHEKVPGKDSLQSVKGASLVKGIPFDFNDPEVAGTDIFARLVPMEAHQASSMYSEEKAKLRRRIASMIQEKNDELESYLASMQLDSFIVDDTFDSVPQELVDCCADLNSRDAQKELSNIMAKINNSYHDIGSKLAELKTMIKEEEEREKEFKVVLGTKGPPNQILIDVKREAEKYSEAHENAQEKNMTLHNAISQHKENISVLSMPLENLLESLPSVAAAEGDGDRATRQEVQRLMKKVREMQTQRAEFENRLKNNLQEDDITKQLVTTQRDMEEFFKEELNKHMPIVSLLEQNMAAQTNILQALSEANAAYASTRRLVNQFKSRRTEFVSSLMSSYNIFLGVIEKAEKAYEFYSKLDSQIGKLISKTKSVCKVQEEEREEKLSANVKKFTGGPYPQKGTEREAVSSSTGPKLKDYLPPKAPGGLLKHTPHGSDKFPAGYNSASTRLTPVGSEKTAPNMILNPHYNMYSSGTPLPPTAPSPGLPQNFGVNTGISTAGPSPFPNVSLNSSLSGTTTPSILPGSVYPNQTVNTNLTKNITIPSATLPSPVGQYSISQNQARQFYSNSTNVKPSSVSQPVLSTQSGSQPNFPSQSFSSSNPSYSYPQVSQPQTFYPVQPYQTMQTHHPLATHYQQLPQTKGTLPSISQYPGVYQQHPTGTFQQPSIQGTLQQPSAQGTIPTTNVQGTVQQPSIQGTVQQPSIQGTVQQPNIGTIQHPNVQGNFQSPNIQGILQQPSVQGTVQQPNVQGTIQQPNVQSTHQMPSVQSILQQPSIQGTVQQPIVKGTVQHPNVQGTVKQPNFEDGVHHNQGFQQPLSQFKNVHPTPYQIHQQPATSQYATAANASYQPQHSQGTQKPDFASQFQQPYQGQQQSSSQFYTQQCNSSKQISQGIPSGSQVYPTGASTSQYPGQQNSYRPNNVYQQANYNVNNYQVSQSQPGVRATAVPPSSLSSSISGIVAGSVPCTTNFNNHTSTIPITQANIYSYPYNTTETNVTPCINHYQNYSGHYQQPSATAAQAMNSTVSPSMQPVLQNHSQSHPSSLPLSSSVPASGSVVTTSTSTKENKNKEGISNFDLLSDIDLSAPSSQWCPLTPLPASKPNEEASNATTVPDVTADTGGSIARKGSSQQENELPNLVKSASTRSTSTLNEISQPSPIFDLAQIAKQTKRSASVVDPLTDDKTLNILAQETERFSKYIQGLDKKSLNGPTNIELKWKELMDLMEQKYSTLKVSVGRCYPLKNRFPDILPFDHTRVQLPSHRDDYINASFVQLKTTDEGIPMILTQAPMPNTFSDFWSMVWENQSETIVCLNTDAEVKGQVYLPENMNDVLEFGNLTLTLKQINEAPNKAWLRKTLHILHSSSKTSRVVLHLQFLTWPPSAMPESPSLLLQFINEVHTLQKQQRNKLHPMVVHCISGTGRSGVFTILSSFIRYLHCAGSLSDIWSLVVELYQQRRAAIQDRTYLLFLYTAALYYAQEILMKRGILTDKATFEEGPREKTHVRHPSADLLSTDLNRMKANLGFDHDYLPGSPDSSLKRAGSQSSIISNSSIKSCSSLPPHANTEGTPSPSHSVSPAHVLSQQQLSSNLVPQDALSPGHTAASDEKSTKIGSLPPNLVASLDPDQLKLEMPNVPKPPKITKESFLHPPGIQSGLGPTENDLDPLSGLDPMWSLHKS